MPAKQSDARTARQVQAMSLFAWREPELKVLKGLCRKLLVQSERLKDLATRRNAPVLRSEDLAKVAEDGRPTNPNGGARCRCNIV